MPKYLKAKINKRLVDSLKPEVDRIIVRDTELPGFNLLILPSGLRSYRLQYRNAHSVQRSFTIGHHGDLTPDEARRRAQATEREQQLVVIRVRNAVQAERSVEREEESGGVDQPHY